MGVAAVQVQPSNDDDWGVDVEDRVGEIMSVAFPGGMESPTTKAQRLGARVILREAAHESVAQAVAAV